MRKEAGQKARRVYTLSRELQVFNLFVDTYPSLLRTYRKQCVLSPEKCIYSFAYIFKGFVSEGLLGLRIKPIGKGEPTKDFF